MKKYQVELLAPAGNLESFFGAINAGADAIYLGGNKYGARAYADNFTTKELVFCIRYAHLWGKKIYLTVNTLMKEEELSELLEYLAPLYEAGLDACIVQDIGAFLYIKEHFKEMELHVSTQMTITGPNSARLLKDLGATRIVPARELSLKEIQTIKEETGLEIETFIHGAMCYCYSGQCLFSSILGGRSGNRGRCAQPCRLPYTVNISNIPYAEYYPLSLKDMCTLEHIDAFLEAGIDSFKIEGRMKKPEYAAGVTAIYRKYIDLKVKNPDKPLQFKAFDLEQLSKLYIRSERQDGYYFKQNGKDMVTLTNPAYSGSDEAFLQEIREKYIEQKPRLPISIYATMLLGESVSVTLVYKDLSVTVEGEAAQAATNMPLTGESIEKQLKKLGDTCFLVEDMEIYTDGLCFYSLKELNELRRQAVRKLENEIIRANGLCAGRTLQKLSVLESERNEVKIGKKEEISISKVREKNPGGFCVSISTLAQYEALRQICAQEDDVLCPERIYMESELLMQQQSSFVNDLIPHVAHYISLPYCMRKKDEPQIKSLLTMATSSSSQKQAFQGFLVRNLEEYAFLQSLDYPGEIRTDAGIYIWNSKALQFWKDKVTGVHCPTELNKREWCRLFAEESMEKLVYGRLPLMITANCVAKTTAHCIHGKENTIVCLTDRYQKQFPVALVCEYCMNIIYNSVPVSLHKDVTNTLYKYDKKLQFTVESKEETLAILNFFKKIAMGQLTEPPYRDYTTGHEKRGVL